MNGEMKATLLGTGTSQGVPVIGCKCDVCRSVNLKDKRLRSSLLIQTENTTVVIDSGPDFREQMLRFEVDTLDAIIFTHEHRDHIAGLDDVRSYNYLSKKPMDVFAEERVQKALGVSYDYVFTNNDYPGIPRLNIHLIQEDTLFSIGNIEIEPIRVMHSKLPILGFKIGEIAYITDLSYISEKEKEKLKGVEVLIVDGLRKEEHISHLCLQQSLELISELHPARAYITHIGHQMGLHNEVQKELPENVFLAFDGLSFSV